MKIEKKPKKVALYWIIYALASWLIIIASVVLTHHYLNAGTFFICLIVVMSRFHALMILGHDAAHFLVCDNKKINDLLAYLFISPTAFSLNGYRQFHFLHHRYVNTNKDPELKIRDPNHRDYILPKNKKEFLLIAVKDVLGLNILYTFKIFMLFKPQGLKDYLYVYVSQLIIIAIILYFKAYWILLLLIMGNLLIFPLLFRIRTWTEHWGSNSTHLIKAGALSRFFLFPCNTWCHKEHHQFPNIPFWYLSKIRTAEDKKKAKSFLELMNSFNAKQESEAIY